MALDPEVEAMSNISKALEPLTEDARERVLRWAFDRYRDQSNSTSHKRLRANSLSSKENEHRSAPDPTNFSDFSELFVAADPNTDAEKALVAGYWLQEIDGQDDFEALPVNKALKNLGHGIGNITRAFNQLMSSKPSLAMQVKKQGSTRQARKRYKLTRAGNRKIEAMIAGESE